MRIWNCLTPGARRASAAVLAIALVALSATSAAATTVRMRSDAMMSTGFNNASLQLAPTHTIGIADWMPAGTGVAMGISIAENQCLRLQSQAIGTCNSSLPLGAGPFASEVTWNLTNTSGLSGPALLFFSGVANFATGTSYDPSEIRITVPNAEAKVVKYTNAMTDYYYLAFLISDFSKPIKFTYEVDATQLAGGTPKLLVNSAFAFVPEPSTALLVCAGLTGLGLFGRRRSA